jgi:superfamily II DNA or RNA helicase
MGESIMKPIITVESVIRCHANPEARKKILKHLKYKDTYFKRGKFGGGENQIVTKHFVTGRKGSSGRFLTGLLPRLQKKTGITVERKHLLQIIKPQHKKPSLEGITFRPDQLKALRKIKFKQRGRIIFPTGTGKTVIAAGAISMWTNIRWLFLCHTKDLLQQTSEEFGKFGITNFKNGDGHKIHINALKNLSDTVVVSTIQSVKNLKDLPVNYFQGVIVDEVHHAADLGSMYGKFLVQCQAPIRIGFTATKPSNEYQELVNEGLFGPVICELTPQEGAELGILAQTCVKIIPIEYNPQLKKRTFQETVDKCIVNNSKRNQIIMDESRKIMKEKGSVLIIVDKLEHGRVIQEMFERRKLKIPFVEGQRDGAFRNNVKNKLKDKDLLCAICTKVWREGINIPSLNCIIYAAGGKEEKSVKQAMGRGLRISEGKSHIQLIDFLDPYPWIANHSIQRFKTYYDLNWIKQ